MTTMHDVAKAAGVSQRTVSHVLNGTRAIAPRRCATPMQRLIASDIVAACDRKPSKLASTISNHTSAIGAMGEKALSVIETIRASRLRAACVSATVSLA